MALTRTFKFRVRPGLLKRANRVRRAMGYSKSEFGREAFMLFLVGKEQEFGLADKTNGKAAA